MASNAQLNFDDLRIRAAIMRGVVQGVNSVSVELGNAVRTMLSQPGGGRVYIRGRDGAFNKTAVREQLRARAIATSGQRDRYRFITRTQAAAVLKARRAKGLKNRSLRKLGFHKASAPGQPPAVDTGNLRRSWQVGFSNPREEKGEKRYLLRVGSNAKYARRMEFGGGSIAARPYVRPAIEMVRPKARGIIVDAIRAELAKFVRARGGKP